MAKISSVKVDSKIPEGPLAEKWTNYKAHQKLVNPANKRKLDIIVVLGIGLHLFNFWAKMQLPEVLHMMGMHVDAVTMENVANGSYYIASTFSCPVYAAIYVIWLAALWFHLTHGIWSSMQTLGVNNNVWICRWKAIGNVLATIIILGFLVVVVAGYFGLGALGKIALECGAACC